MIDQLFADSNGRVWQVDDVNVEKDIFDRKTTCIEASRLDTSKRKWIPQQSFRTSLNDEEDSAYTRVDDVGECDECGHIHAEGLDR